MKKGTNKSKWILIATSLIILVVGAYFFTDSGEDKLVLSTDSKPMRKAKPVDLEDFPLQWKEVETYEEVNQFYEERVQGLKLARKEGLTTYPQESFPIPDKDGRMQVNEVWHSGHMIHILYSIDLSALTEEDHDEQGNPYLSRPPALEAIHIKKSTETNEQSFESHSRELNPHETIVFENRVYSLIQVPPITEEWGYNYTREDIRNYNEEFLTSFRLRIDLETIETEGIPIRYKHDLEGHVLDTFTTDEVYEDGNVTIEPLEVNIGVASSHVKMRVDAEDKEIGHSIQAVIKSEEGARHPISLFLSPTQEGNVYESWFHPASELPGDVSMELESIHLKDDTPYSFDIDMTQFEDNRRVSKTFDRKVGEAYDTDIILKRVNIHNRQQMDIELQYEPHHEQQSKKLVGAQVHRLNTTPKEQKKYGEVISDNGKTAEAVIWGHDQQGNINFQLRPFRNSDNLTITVKRMIYSQQLDHTFDFK